MGIVGRWSARRRLRRPARPAPPPGPVPVVTPSTDCTPWVLGGLWPVELAHATGHTATLAEYLHADLQRIAHSANQRLAALRRAGSTARSAEEQQVIKLARSAAVLRVDSTVRQLRNQSLDHRLQALDVAESTMPADGVGSPPEPVPESDDDRLHRLLMFVARQQPELHWAIGDIDDGGTLLVTDVAHGWVPPGIRLPAGVRLLEPRWRDADLVSLLGRTTRTATYTPGDRLGWATDSDPDDDADSAARELPVLEDLGGLLGTATEGRDGLPLLAHTVANAAGAGVGDGELDLLRVHLDTARYQLVADYPHIDAATLLNTLLLAATDGIATGDMRSANYHFSWFQALNDLSDSGGDRAAE